MTSAAPPVLYPTVPGWCPACEEAPCKRRDLHAGPGEKLIPIVKTCATCVFYVENVADGGTTHLGRCRRRAPTMAGWPAVFEADWCGDHQIDETKLEATT